MTTQSTRRATVCRVCGYRLLDVSGRGVHPLCDTSDELWWTPMDTAEATRAIARRAIAASPAPNDLVAAVCALLVIDPSNRDHVEAVVSAVIHSAANDSPLWRTTANSWRPLLPIWIRPALVGATVQRLVSLGLLRPTERWVRCDDIHSGNRGKPQRIYELDTELLDHITEQAAP